MENESYSGAKNTYKLSSTATHLTVTVGDLEPPRPSMRDQEQTTLRDKPGCFQLWASFPTSSKLFLFFSVAFAAGGTIFAIVQFRQVWMQILPCACAGIFAVLPLIQMYSAPSTINISKTAFCRLGTNTYRTFCWCCFHRCSSFSFQSMPFTGRTPTTSSSVSR